MEARNLASRDSIGRVDIIKDVRERHHRLPGNRKKGSNAGHAGRVMFAGGGGGCRWKGRGGGGRGKGDGGGGHGKGGGHGNENGERRGQHGRGGKGSNEDGGGSAAVAGSDDSSAKAAEGSTPEARCYKCGQKGHWRSTERRTYVPDAKDGGTLPMSAPRSRRSDAAVATDGGMLLISSPRRKKTLFWRCQTTTVIVLRSRLQLRISGISGRKREGESAWQVGDEARRYDSEASAHMTPSADCMINNRECNLKVRTADGSTHSIERYGDITLSFGPETVSCKRC